MLREVLKFVAAVTLAGLAVIVSPRLGHADSLQIARAGFAAKEQRKFDQAVRLFDEALRLGLTDERRAFVIYSRGVSYEALGMREKALADFDTAIAFLPGFVNSYIYRGIIWGDLRQFAYALQDFSKAAELSPRDPIVFNNLADTYQHLGDIDRALQNFDIAIRLDPTYAEAYYNRAAAFLARGDFDRAIADYGQAIWLQPRFAAAYGNRGALHLSLGRIDAAIADFSEAIELSPRDTTYLSNRANAYLAAARYTDATTDFSVAIDYEPGNVALYLGRGRAKLFFGESEAAATDFVTALRLRPTNPHPAIWLHITRVHEGKPDAEELNENASKIDRDHWPGSVLDLYLGRLTPDHIRKMAEGLDAKGRVTRLCEAEFFIAEMEHHSDRVRGAKALDAVIERCSPDVIVYSAAKAEKNLATR
jgi:tetratricopeptide (TPR) repeat protein